MQRRGWDQTDLANALGSSNGVVNRWLYGERRPTAASMAKIYDVLKIKMVAWVQPPSEPFAPPGKERADAAAEAAS